MSVLKTKTEVMKGKMNLGTKTVVNNKMTEQVNTPSFNCLGYIITAIRYNLCTNPKFGLKKESNNLILTIDILEECAGYTKRGQLRNNNI
jgi:hypothetical protein